VKVLDVQSSITDPNPIASGPFWSDPGSRSEATKIDIFLPFFHKNFHLQTKSLKYANFSSLWSGSWTGSGSSPKRPDLTKKVRIQLDLNPQHCSVHITQWAVGPIGHLIGKLVNTSKFLLEVSRILALFRIDCFYWITWFTFNLDFYSLYMVANLKH
jgi:hypothetical protein